MAPSLTDNKHREQPLAPHLLAERFWSAEWRGLEPRGRSHGQPAFGALRHAWAAPASKGKRDPLTGVGVRRSEAVHAILGAPAAHGVPNVDYASAATAKRTQGYSVRNSITRHAVRACPTLADRNAITGRGVEYFVVVEVGARGERESARAAARPLSSSSESARAPRNEPPLVRAASVPPHHVRVCAPLPLLSPPCNRRGRPATRARRRRPRRRAASRATRSPTSRPTGRGCGARSRRRRPSATTASTGRATTTTSSTPCPCPRRLRSRSSRRKR